MAQRSWAKGSLCTRRTFFALVFLTLIVLCCAGCLTWKSSDGTRHHLILGVGLVAVKESPDQTATALRANTLGLAVHPTGVALGYQSLQVTTFAPDWQGLVNVSCTPGQPLTVQGQSPGALLPAPSEAPLLQEETP